MKITFLGQGYEAISQNSVGNQLIKFLSEKDFHSFTAISAFASESAINGISKYVEPAKNVFKNINFFVGIDQKGTSKEALEAILELDINSFIFHQPASPIFHPKIYLFEGIHRSEVIIGSSNLTSPGLFTNVETSLLIGIDNLNEEDRRIVFDLKQYFRTLFDFSDPKCL